LCTIFAETVIILIGLTPFSAAEKSIEVIIMQQSGSISEVLLSGSISRAIGALRLGLTRMIIMITGGYLTLSFIAAICKNRRD